MSESESETLQAEDQTLPVTSVSFARKNAIWTMFLILPQNRFYRYWLDFNSKSPSGKLIRTTAIFADPPGMPNQESKGALDFKFYLQEAHGRDENVYAIDHFSAAYKIDTGVQPLLTPRFFENKIVKQGHALETRNWKDLGSLHWCVAALDALETEGAVASGQTMLFVSWLKETNEERAKTPSKPQIGLPKDFSDFVKSLDNMSYGHRNLQSREISGSRLKK